jgi:hypothetical protein
LKLSNDGLSLWYGTPDAPAPFDDEVMPRQGVSVVVAVQPANPTNRVFVRFRVDRGAVQTAPGRDIRTDYGRNVQYFAVAFPAFYTGQVVEYAPVFMCGGRQCPAAYLADRFRSKFRLEPQKSVASPAPEPALARSSPPARGAQVKQTFDAGLAFVATVEVKFREPQYVGEIPWGMRINWVIASADVSSSAFHGTMLEAAVDDMLIRRDGMGVVRMRATIKLDDGALLDVESGGYVDFGPDGYRRAVAHDLPDQSPVALAPLISTRHPKYAWLGRIQCIGVGQTHLDDLWACYDIYAVNAGKLGAARP